MDLKLTNQKVEAPVTREQVNAVLYGLKRAKPKHWSLQMVAVIARKDGVSWRPRNVGGSSESVCRNWELFHRGIPSLLRIWNAWQSFQTKEILWEKEFKGFGRGSRLTSRTLSRSQQHQKLHPTALQLS